MKSMRFVAGMLALMLVLASSAYALGGPVLLGFLDDYTAPDGSRCTHRGIDVGMAGGAEVASPASGQVRFAGRVPGPHGGSVIAVSIETEDGVVSMLPFADAHVSTGEHIEKGDPVGDVAAQGDPSSDSAHLHLGFKRGGVYADPSFLIEAVAPAAPDRPDALASPVIAPAPQPAASAAPVVPTSVPLVHTPSVAPAGTPVNSTSAKAGSCASSGSQPITDHEGATAPVPEGVANTASAGVGAQSAVVSEPSPAAGGLAPGVTLATADAPARPADAGTAAHAQPGGSTEGPSADDPRLDTTPHAIEPGAIGYGVALLSAASFAAVLLLTRRALTRRVAASPPVSDRLGILLQHLKAGDTLCGLTSCSGHAAFTVPGPLAQRR